MDATTLIAALQAAVPGLHCDAAPSVDLQTTIYVSRDDVPAVARALRESADLRFALLAELTQGLTPSTILRKLPAHAFHRQLTIINDAFRTLERSARGGHDANHR